MPNLPYGFSEEVLAEAGYTGVERAGMMLRLALHDKDIAVRVEAAKAWCSKQGVDSVSMLIEVQAEQELVDALALKPLKARQLLAPRGWSPATVWVVLRRARSPGGARAR